MTQLIDSEVFGDTHVAFQQYEETGRYAAMMTKANERIDYAESHVYERIAEAYEGMKEQAKRATHVNK